jgi:hypothetical protein
MPHRFCGERELGGIPSLAKAHRGVKEHLGNQKPNSHRATRGVGDALAESSRASETNHLRLVSRQRETAGAFAVPKSKTTPGGQLPVDAQNTPATRKHYRESIVPSQEQDARKGSAAFTLVVRIKDVFAQP